jgi:hypothetical protein
MSFDAESQRSWGQTKVPQNPPLYQGGVPQVVVDGDDEFFQVHRQVENSLKQMVQNFGQIMFASERLGTERDTVDFRDQLYILSRMFRQRQSFLIFLLSSL